VKFKNVGTAKTAWKRNEGGSRKEGRGNEL